MFYSQLLLAKKGALGVVWLAAHCHKMLKKEQVDQTNIAASVDKILNDEAKTFTYRILAFLLLGVVRIYSKKVEYLLNDSQKIVNKLNEVTPTRRKSRCVKFLPSNYKSIALPARYELDAFDLELSGDQAVRSVSLRSRKKFLLAGGHRKESDTRGSSKDKMPVSPASCYTPLKDVLSPYHAHRVVSASSLAGVSATLSGPSLYQESRFLEEEHLEPMDMGEAEDEETHHKAVSFEDPRTSPQNLTTDASLDTYTDMERSFEIARGTVFNLDERFEPLILDDEENELITNGKSSSREDVNINIRSPVEFAESPLPQRSDPVSSLGILEKSLLSSDHGHILMEENLMSMTTPVVELPDTQAGETTAEVSITNTPPATNETRPKTSRKRKISIKAVSVSNKEYKSWLADTSNITRKRKVVTDTFRRIWRTPKLCHMPESLLEPVIPGDSVKLGSLGNIQSSTVVNESVETSPNQDPGHASPLDYGDFGENMEVRVPHEQMSSQQLKVADENLTTKLDARRRDGTLLEAETDVLQPTITEGPVWDESVSHEDSISLEGDSGAGKGDVFSARTRMTGEYLSRKFLEKKKQKGQGGDQPLNMSQMLEGKTKKDSARLFYEILVLKSRDCINVQQDNAYDDILLRETPKMAEMLGA